MLIDCNQCTMQHSAHCDDCIVSVLVDPKADDGAVVIDADEERALREMAKVGLIPIIRMKRREAPSRSA